MLTIQPAKPGRHGKKRAIGIDLGTTHSLVALQEGQGVRLLGDEQGDVLLPSVVRYLSEKERVVGKEAKQAYEDDPHNTLMSVKRYMGRAWQWETCAGKLSPVEVSSHVLVALMERVRAIDSRIDQAVITVPAYFDEIQRQATKLAAEQAGIEVLRLLNEPTAAAIAYGLDKQASGTCLVFDLGGGTFDVSLLRLSRGIFEVLATGGDTALGGDDIDRLIMAKTGLPWMAARRLKERLSTIQSVEYFERATLNQLVTPLLERMVSICKQVLRDANVSRQDIDHVILVGGATRMPVIQETVESFFGKRPLCTLDPDYVVAQGAALQAAVLSGHFQEEGMLLLDVTPLSLGVEMMGGVVEKIIARNTAIPAVATAHFTTYADGQTGLSLHILQGEREGVEDCQSLAHFDLMGIPPMPAGKARVEVMFRLDADGLLTVEAKELLSGVRSEIVVKPTFDLSESLIEACIEEALLHQDADQHKRKWRKALLEAKQLIENIDKGILQSRAFLLTDEHDKLRAAREAVIAAMEAEDQPCLKQAMEILTPWAVLLAERQLNDIIKKTMVSS